MSSLIFSEKIIIKKIDCRLLQFSLALSELTVFGDSVSVVDNSVSGQRRPCLDSVEVQADLGLCYLRLL